MTEYIMNYNNIINSMSYQLTIMVDNKTINTNQLIIKLSYTDNLSQSIINGLYKGQECFFKFTNKGINVYTNHLICKGLKRTIRISGKTFIGFIPFKYVKQIRKKKKKIKSINIKHIKNKKQSNKKNIIICVKFKDDYIIIA